MKPPLRLPAPLPSAVLLLVALLISPSLAQQYGSFFQPIYINSPSDISASQVSCASMGNAQYCCASGQYCALDSGGALACCGSGLTCQGNNNNNNNNGQEESSQGQGEWQQSTTQQLYYTTQEVVVVVTETELAQVYQVTSTTTVVVEEAPPEEVTQEVEETTQQEVQTQVVETTQEVAPAVLVQPTQAAEVTAQSEEVGTCGGAYVTSRLVEAGPGLPATKTQGCTVLDIVSGGGRAGGKTGLLGFLAAGFWGWVLG